ncbi:RB1-inducible coiled-coil protein 1 isoform X2 [Halyomorpha halys]|uniref:RB1-inducible coiled-coil protein 1 isoform X2 n=1 Tax=Halyomorpha halys TaxID=286706 RepID=UPI000D0C7D2D|nr:RB1-inducible coiled-coil protein 1 isoform X2 [Halyomorpha halys]
MMLYIFHVDTGNMLSVDMNLALEDCIVLKEAIKKLTGIPVDKQVLLASGGESLEPNVRVCSYSAGTDTNPIYLFSKASIDATSPPVASIDPIPNADLKEEVDASLNLPPTIQTVNMRCQLAQQMCEQAKQISRVCDKLIHEQHLQQQGWAAVMANLEDVTTEFSNRSAAFEAAYTQYLETRPQYIEMLDNFSNDIGLLSQIPILPVLAETIGETSNEETSMEGSESNKTISSEEKKKIPRTLLEWISDKDSQYRVDQVAEICRKGLEQFNETVLEELKKASMDPLDNFEGLKVGKFDVIIMEEIKTEVKTTLEISKKCHYREIKGLGDRLFGLDKLKTEAKKAFQEQVDLAQAFVHNQLRANNLGDASILPDLCTSHKKQLVVMLQNHMQLRDLKRRIYKAKQELVINLHHRLKWVMFTECRINELEMKLMMYRECLKRLRKQLTVLQQLHMAPSVYMTTVSEIVRRRAFSQAFLVWANDLACQLCAIYSEEVARRKNFHSQFEGHFLSSMFPGLEDMPPSFATQPPEPFDDSLPKLTVEDIETLKTQLPKLELLLSVPDTASITQFFLSRSSTNLKPEPPNPTASIEDRIVEAVTAAGLSSNLDPALLQPATECSQSLVQSATTTTQPISSDRHKNILYRGFESETDTEEFEKFVQSPGDVCVEKQQDPIHQEKQEETICTKGEDAKDLRIHLERMGSTVGEAMAELKTDVGHLKQWILCEQTELEGLISQIQEACSRQHESLLKEIDEKKWALEKLNQSRDKLTKELNSLREEMKVQEMMKIQESKPVTVLKKTDVDKKPRNTTRSVSESHIAFPEVQRLELKDHDEIVARLKEQLAIERERAVQEERMRCEARLNQQLAQAVIKADADKQALFNESFRRFFDKKFESMRSLSQDFDLNRSDLFGDTQMFSDALMKIPSSTEEKINKIDLVKSMASSSSPKSRQKEASPSSSIVTIESNQSLVRDAATSPEPSPRKCRVSKEKLSESTNSLIQQGKISVGSCNEGDIVLVIWDETFGTYTILQETSSYTYFLHLDSLCSLGLRANPRKQYVIGEVVNKEYCQAKKAENRYNVPVGSRFYRVRVRPLQAKGHTAPQHAHTAS